MVKDWRLGPGMPFLDSDTCAEGRGGYLFLPGFSSLYDAIHGWMTGRKDGKSFTRTTSFTICNIARNNLLCTMNMVFPLDNHINNFGEILGV